MNRWQIVGQARRNQHAERERKGDGGMMSDRLPKPKCECGWSQPTPASLTMGIDFLNGGSITTVYQLDVFGKYVPVHTTIDGRDIDIREVN